jgi:uncharacterized membrane protein YqaE (UPF0057 family)
MKHNKLFTAIAAFAAAAFIFSSCSTTDGLTIEKRRYRDGYYVAKNKRNDNKAEEKQVVLSRETITPQQAAALEQKAVQPEALKGEVQPVAEQTTPAVQSAPATAATVKAVTETKKEVASVTKKEVREAAKTAVKQAKKDPKKSADDVPDVVIILLCIFLSPLAVYLIKGDIDNDFWINLVLWILCGIPGIIHAFIVYSRNK